MYQEITGLARNSSPAILDVWLGDEGVRLLDGILMIMEIKITDSDDWPDTTVKADSKELPGAAQLDAAHPRATAQKRLAAPVRDERIKVS